MAYDLSNPNLWIRDCPRCRHTMVPLRNHIAFKRNEGYLADYGPGSFLAEGMVLGEIWLALRLFIYHVFQPILSQKIGNRRQRKLQNIFLRFPNALICEQCGMLLKRS